MDKGGANKRDQSREEWYGDACVYTCIVHMLTRINKPCVQVINKPCVRETRYMRLISWTHHHGSEQILSKWSEGELVDLKPTKNNLCCSSMTKKILSAYSDNSWSDYEFIYLRECEFIFEIIQLGIKGPGGSFNKQTKIEVENLLQGYL